MDTPSSPLVSLSINRLEMSAVTSLTPITSTDDEEARSMRRGATAGPTSGTAAGGI